MKANSGMRNADEPTKAFNNRKFSGNDWRAGYREIGLSSSEGDTRKPDSRDPGAVCLLYHGDPPQKVGLVFLRIPHELFFRKRNLHSVLSYIEPNATLG